VEFYADLDGDGQMDMMMGDNTKSPAQPVTFRIQLSVKVAPEATYTVNVIKNGKPLDTLKLSGNTPFITFQDTPAAEGRTYYRTEVEGPATAYPQVPKSTELSGTMVGLSNPIYFNFDPNF